LRIPAFAGMTVRCGNDGTLPVIGVYFSFAKTGASCTYKVRVPGTKK